MHPEWLRSVVWAFTTFPGVDVLYGARTNQDPGAQSGLRSGMMPTLEFAYYDRARHESANYVDRNMIALRAALRDIRYDESLRAACDWDHSLRLFARSEPLALPALACYYRTVVSDRISDIPERGEAVRRVRPRAHASRPLRVLVHTAMYPVISETYIGEDIDALQRAGAVVTVSAVQEAVSRAEGAPPSRLDVDAAIEEADADIVLMHWVSHAYEELGRMERHGQPFACRVHSFDVNAEQVQRILEHPLCVGVFAHPHHLGVLPAGSAAPPHGRPDGRDPRESRRARPGPLRVRWTTEEGPRIPGPDIGRAAGARAHDHPRPVEWARGRSDQMRTDGGPDRPHHRGAHQRATTSGAPGNGSRASVLLYTLAPDGPMGYPMSIIEAMLCGTIPVAPDRPEARAIVGPSLRGYRDGADVVRHVREVMEGGDAIESERQELIRLAQRHRDPTELVRLHDALRDGLTEWRAARD